MQSQRTTPLRNPHTSTSDLLTWSEQPPPESSASGYRSRQPSDKIGEVLRGSQLTTEEAQSLTKKKPCSGYKLKEMTGSGIFSGNSEDTTSEENSANSKNRTSIRVYKQAMNGISQISFSTEGNISPKKPTSLPEIAKQRELGGTYQSETVTKINKQTSSAKTKELSGSDIFAPPSEIVPRSLAAAHTLESKESKDTRISVPQKVSTSAQVSNRADGQSNFSFSEQPVKILRKKMHDQKFAEMTGNDIFKGDVSAGSPEKPSSRAKLREMAGSDIFADGKAESRDHILGARRPLGGGSDIFADGKAESRDHILGTRRPPDGGSDIFADGKAVSRDHILGARRPPGGGSDIFADGKAESRDHILGARRPPDGGSDIFADGKAVSRDHILGARRPPGGGSSIALV